MVMPETKEGLIGLIRGGNDELFQLIKGLDESMLDVAGVQGFRSVKDILSDTSDYGLLKHIIMHQKEGSLGFYLVFMGGFRKILFPEILEAFKTFMETGNWECIEAARQSGYARGVEIAEELLSMYRMHKNDTDYFLQLIEQRFVSKLQ